MYLHVNHIGACNDTDIQILSRFGKNAGSPQKRNIGYRLDSVLDPLDNILLDGMSAQHDQNLFLAEQRSIHRIKSIGNQILVERIVKENAFSVEQIQRGTQIVMIQIKTVFVELVIISGKRNHLWIHVIEEVFNHLVVGNIVGKRNIDVRVLNQQLVAEQIAEIFAH